MRDNAQSWEKVVVWFWPLPELTELVIAFYYDDPLFYAKDFFHQIIQWTQIQKRLTRGKGKVLDLGAGRDVSSFAHDGWDLINIEPDLITIVETMIIRQLVPETKLPVSVHQTLAETLPFKDKSFDVVSGRQILHHDQELKVMCDKIVRVLKPGGIFIVTREQMIKKSKYLNFFSGSASHQKVQNFSIPINKRRMILILSHSHRELFAGDEK